MAPWLRTYGSYQGRECSTRPCHGSGNVHSALEHSQLTYGYAIGMSGMQLLRCWYCAIPGLVRPPLLETHPAILLLGGAALPIIKWRNGGGGGGGSGLETRSEQRFHLRGLTQSMNSPSVVVQYNRYCREPPVGKLENIPENVDFLVQKMHRLRVGGIKGRTIQ